MFSELFIACIKAGLPVGVASYLLVWWALRNGYLGDAETFKQVEVEVKRLARDKESKKVGDPVHRKWLALGGGFYGVMALLTLLYIEFVDIAAFVTGFDGFGQLAELFSVSTLVSLFVETITNTIAALAWPMYWLGDTRTDYAWLWFAVAYGGYWLGCDLATRRFRERAEDSA